MKSLLNLDLWVQKFVNYDIVFPFNDTLMIFWSAQWPWILVVLSILLHIISLRDWYRLGAFCWIALTVGLSDSLSSFMIKPWVGRIRPCRIEGLVRVVDGCAGFYTFPSNHAANAAVFATLWFLVFSRWQGGILAACAFMIGFSRVYLGVHYPSDVLGGYVLGILLGGLSYAVWQNLISTRYRAWIERKRG